MISGINFIVEPRAFTYPNKRMEIKKGNKMSCLCNRWCRWRCATVLILAFMVSFIFLSFLSSLPPQTRLSNRGLLSNEHNIGKNKFTNNWEFYAYDKFVNIIIIITSLLYSRVIKRRGSSKWYKRLEGKGPDMALRFIPIQGPSSTTFSWYNHPRMEQYILGSYQTFYIYSTFKWICASKRWTTNTSNGEIFHFLTRILLWKKDSYKM